MAQPSPIQSWNRTFPCVVSAAKSGAESLMRSDIENSSLKVLVEGGTRSIILDGPILSCQGFRIFPAPFPTGEEVGGWTRRRQIISTNTRKSQPGESSGARRRVEQIKLCT